MNDSDADIPAAETAPQADAAPAKTVRRRRATKVADAADASASTAPEGTVAPAAPVGSEAPPKPARKRRTPKAAESVVVEGASGDAAVESAPVVAAPRAEPVRDEAPRSVVEPAERPVVAESAASDGAGDAAAGDGEGADADAGQAPRSSRNRRRGRKDRDRPRQEGQAEGAAGPVPAQAAAAQAGEVFAQVLSGDFDVEPAGEPEAEAAEPEEAHKRVLAPEPDAPKLHKVLAQSGIGSRRDMEQLIEDGHVTVNDQPAHVGQRISFGDQIKVNGKPVRVRIVPPPPRIIAYHKPVGEVVTLDDPENRPTVFRRLPRLQQGKWQSVGRLDLNTEGLLLFTTSGELANQLMHPRFGVEREYAVRVLGTLTEEAKASLLAGVPVEGQTASFKSIEDGGGDGANRWYRVVITEGRNREVRKLFDAVGLTVSRLIRIRYGTVVLPRGLKRGVWVDLDDNDVRTIRRLAGGGQGQGQGQERGQRGNQNQPRQQNDRGGRGAQNSPRHPERGNDRQGERHNDRNRAQDRPPRESQVDDVDRDEDLDFDPSKIPNPLEQTFDKRFVSKSRSPVGGVGFGRGGGGFGAGGSAPQRQGQGGGKKGGGPREPDPLQTSVGYIGADAFHRKGNRGGGRGGNKGGGGGGGGFGGGRRGR